MKPLALLALLLFPASAFCDESLPELLKRLDARAAAMEKDLGQALEKPVHVAALVSRTFALPLDKERAYTVATYSFEHATRDDADNVVRNDWDLLYGNGQGDPMTVRTVTDDTSRIWDLGEADFDAFQASDAGQNAGSGDENVLAKKKHLYVVHTVDTETNLWAKFQVLELEADKSVILRWEVIADPTEWRALERTPGAAMRSGRVQIQVRAGAMGGNPCRAYMNGKTSAYVQNVSANPIDMAGNVDIGEDAAVWVSGGFIPQGKVWILRAVEYSGLNSGDSNGDGPFVVSAGGQELARREERSGEFKDAWKGRLVLRPGQEDTVFVEISNSSRADVVFRGVLCDEKLAETTKFPALGADEKKRVNALVAALDADDAEAREKATQGLLDMGPAILDYLKTVPREKWSAEARARLEEVIAELGGE